jgi:hypothetical protein
LWVGCELGVVVVLVLWLGALLWVLRVALAQSVEA